ncbi:MAG: 50S ribosomal protein L6, partial [Candidatus Nanoarchaeia archaeon]
GGRIVEIPEDVNVEVDGQNIMVKSGDKQIEREFANPNISIVKEGQEIKIRPERNTKREAKLAGTIQAHIRNMINGMKEDYVYKLEICNVHFPMNVKVQGNEVVIKSFLGESQERKAKILDNVKVDIKDSEVSVSSFNREAAGQTAANIEKAVKVPGKDRRIFQDGIFIKEKPGREI